MKNEISHHELFTSDASVILKASEYSLEISEQGRGMLFNSRTGDILSLNQTGAFLVQALNTPQTPPELSRRFAARFSLELDAAKDDVLEFLAALRNLNLLEIVETP